MASNVSTNSCLHSYLHWALHKVVASDWLYPSTQKLTQIEDKGSILESIGDGKALFNVTVVDPRVRTRDEVTRALFRTMALIFSSAVMAPCGVIARLYSLCRAGLTYVCSSRPLDLDRRLERLNKEASSLANACKMADRSQTQRRPQRRHELSDRMDALQAKLKVRVEAQLVKVKAEIEKLEKEKQAHPKVQSWRVLKECGIAIATDALSAFGAWWIIYSVYRISQVPAKIFLSLSPRMIKSWDPTVPTLAWTALGFSGMFSCLGFWPTDLLVALTQDYERVSLYKAIELRHQFGLVNQNNGLLNFDSSKDDEKIVDDRPVGHFSEILATQTYDLLIEIRNTQHLLASPPPPSSSKDSFLLLEQEDCFIPEHYPPRCDKILECLYKAKTQNRITQEQYSALFDQFRKLFRDFDRAHSLFYEFFKIKFPDNVRIPNLKNEFPFARKYCAQFFTPPPRYEAQSEEVQRAQSDLESTILQTRSLLTQEENYIVKEKDLPLYNDIKSSIKSGVKQDKEYEILCLSEWPKTLKEFNAAYKKCARILHPDKYGQADPDLQREAEAFFKCCGAVHCYGIQEKYKTQVGTS